MSPLDKQLITRKAKMVDEDLTKLKEFEAITLEQYKKSLAIRLQVERLLERIIGRVVDINYHILKFEHKTMPTDYYKSFILMGDKGVVDGKLANKLAESAGLRNALAHEYDVIDDEQVYASIGTCLKQIPLYLEQVIR